MDTLCDNPKVFKGTTEHAEHNYTRFVVHDYWPNVMFLTRNINIFLSIWHMVEQKQKPELH